MLKQLRSKKTAKKIWIILAILIVPAFVLWGSGSLMRNKEEPAYAGRIFGKKISLLEYKDALDAVKIAAIMQFGENISEVQKYIDFQTQAWERLILLHEAKKRKIAATDKEVIELIESYPFFQRKNKFDNKVYSEILNYVFHAQPRIFEEHTRNNLLLSKLYKQATDNIDVNEEEIKSEYQKFNEEISLHYIVANFADFAKTILPSEEEMKDYFAKNQLEFKQPISFNLDYITLDSESKIKDAELRLKRKTDFQKLAKEMGVSISETGLFAQTDPVPGFGWSPEILNLISKLKVGEFLGPIHMDKYYYILRVKEMKESYIPDFEKIKDKVKETFIRSKSQEIAKAKIEECLKKLKESYEVNPKLVDFNKSAKECNLKSDSTNTFKYGSYIEGIGASDKLWLAAKELKGDEFSDIIDTPSAFYIIKIKSSVPVDEKKFESDKDSFSQKLLLQKKEEYFAKFIEELKRKAQ